MRIFKNIISIALPDALFLCSQANERNTDEDIFEMGKRLAEEVHQYIRESCPGSQLGRLTFIGHSLGGLIIRAALPLLEKYKDKFHGFMTLCSPHLGYMYKSSKVFDTGMWFLKKWKKSIVLNQLGMTDSKNIEQTTIYLLSQQPGLEWFKHIILVSSFQDQYAPFDSARIQICGDAAKDQKKGNTYI
jgi:predicted alpha/beta hydrolase family esterase